jgi:hypothetical protein
MCGEKIQTINVSVCIPLEDDLKIGPKHAVSKKNEELILDIL